MTIAMAEPEEPEGNFVSRIVKVTPEIAATFLSRDSVNRRLDMGQVRSLTETILRGEWKLTHQGIAFDETGALLDGQHRLHAIIEANTPVEMLVFDGVAREVFPVLDTGKRRSAADTLLSTGAKYLHLLSSTIRHVILFKTMPNDPWSGARAHVSNDRILAAYNEDRDRYGEAVTIGRELSKHLFASQTAAAVGFFVTTDVAPAADIDEWISGLKSGASLDPGDARLALREVPRDTQKRGSKRRMGMRDQVAIYIKAWNSWVEPEKASELRLRRLRKREKMPIPVEVKFER
ncbi:hypothetical protein [Streptomyces tubercidicus]|uniref:ParB/Sulfiredoxin domain-containing protein n=1 Tax=Streptomyces tubercidicus TaxID=47759 RepID=A0A640V097_9ACTN|nr:hypothetical protein [Streptomyces tubercidicus]WAU14578.1 hypothetical protein STRTU_005204 [Streptomyces tubercidicus]GFE40325.1 hypothetical protein Stube_49980 [Streptomyces tubercidicus]